MVPSEKSLINLKEIIQLFFIFIIGNILLFLWAFLILPNFSFKESLRTGFLFGGLLCYVVVLIPLFAYYITLGKEKLIKNFRKKKEKYFIGLVIIIAIIYLIFIFLTEGLISFIKNLLIVILALISITQINKKLLKWWKNLGKNNYSSLN